MDKQPTIPQLRRLLSAALANVDNQMMSGDRDDKFARGLAVEGYAGGYSQAIRDVMLASTGTHPNTSRYWPTWEQHHKILVRRKRNCD